MPRLKIKNLENEQVGEIELSDRVFGAEVKEHLIHEVVRMQNNRKRSGTACAKERSAVSGGGAKPYRQKGTGRARQGSERAANHVGGGIIFGPRPRSYDFSPPKKVRRQAMCSALSLFVNESRLIVVENFDLEDIKTRRLAEVLEKLGANHALIVDSKENKKLERSVRNLASHRFLPTEGLNVLDILRHSQLIVTKKAAQDIEERLERPVRARRAG